MRWSVMRSRSGDLRPGDRSRDSRGYLLDRIVIDFAMRDEADAAVVEGKAGDSALGEAVDEHVRVERVGRDEDQVRRRRLDGDPVDGCEAFGQIASATV